MINTIATDRKAQTENARATRHNTTLELDFIIWNFIKHHPESKPSFIIKELALNKGTFYNFAKRNRDNLLVERQLIKNQIVSYYSAKMTHDKEQRQ